MGSQASGSVVLFQGQFPLTLRRPINYLSLVVTRRRGPLPVLRVCEFAVSRPQLTEGDQLLLHATVILVSKADPILANRRDASFFSTSVPFVLATSSDR